MVAGFKKKKIKPQKTLGDILKNRRKRKGFTLEQIEDGTHIRIRFLEAIEKDCWEELPSDIYSRGYVECYAEFLGLNKEDLLDKFNRERHLYRVAKDQLTPAKSKKPLTTMWLVTPKTFAIGSGLAIILFLSTYIGFQVKSFAQAPELTIVYPQQGDQKQVVKDDKISLSGIVSTDAKLKINGKLVEVGNNGKFKEVVGLSKGENTFVVSAIGRNMKSSVELVTIEADF